MELTLSLKRLVTAAVAGLMRRERLSPAALWCYQWLYPSPVVAISPERLYLYLDTLFRRKHLPGSIVEVGSFLCGTSIMAVRMLKSIGSPKPYICVDTFAGFVPAQIASDIAKGTPGEYARGFPASLSLVSRIVKRSRVTGLQLIQADICGAVDLPESIAVALLDVDLEEPIYAGLRKLYPRLVAGGCILVDDCHEGQGWRARFGYRRFCEEEDLPERYLFGMGMIEKP